MGRFCLRQLDAYGIDRRFVQVQRGEARNSLAVVETRLQDTQSVIYRNGAADFEMVEDDVATLPYAGYSALVTTGTVLAAEPSRSACFAAFERARAPASAAGLRRRLPPLQLGLGRRGRAGLFPRRRSVRHHHRQ